MILHCGRQLYTKFVLAKAIRFGYTLWMIASTTGLAYQVGIYKGPAGNQSNDPLEAHVVKDVLQICSNLRT